MTLKWVYFSIFVFIVLAYVSEKFYEWSVFIYMFNNLTAHDETAKPVSQQSLFERIFQWINKYVENYLFL